MAPEKSFGEIADQEVHNANLPQLKMELEKARKDFYSDDDTLDRAHLEMKIENLEEQIAKLEQKKI
jgi:hypothetical protein